MPEQSLFQTVMSKRRKRKVKYPPSGAPVHRKTLPITVIVAAIILLGVLAASGLWLTRQTVRAVENVSAASPVASAPADKPATQRSLVDNLISKWSRTDANYILEIKSIAADGRMDVAYLNPKSIYVAEAQASRDGQGTRLFLQLQDVNYPGSTYSLVYEPKTDMLEGVYYHAGLKQTFDVVFVRSR